MESKLLFEVVEPGGKVYRAFTDGAVEGFAPGSLVDNRCPALVLYGLGKAREEGARATHPLF